MDLTVAGNDTNIVNEADAPESPLTEMTLDNIHVDRQFSIRKWILASRESGLRRGISFLEGLDYYSQNLLRPIISSPQFVKAWLEGAKEVEIPYPRTLDSSDLYDINELLNQFALTVHCEVGCHLISFKFYHENEKGTLEFRSAKYNSPLDEGEIVPYEEITIDEDHIEQIQSYMLNPKHKEFPVTDDAIRKIVFLTHNRDEVFNVLLEHVEVLRLFDRKAHILIADDSNDKESDIRKKKIEDFMTQNSGNGITFSYFGIEERESRLKEIMAKIAEHPKALALCKSGFKISEMVVEALTGGVGANRNWGVVNNLTENYIQIDDDVRVRVPVRSETDFINVPVDLLSSHNQLLQVQDVVGGWSQYSGALDILSGETYVLNLLSLVSKHQKEAVGEVFGTFVEYNALMPWKERFVVLSSMYPYSAGGAMSFNVEDQPVLARLPFPTTAERYLRHEDLVQKTLVTILKESRNPNSSWNREEKELLFASPGGTVFHDRNPEGRPCNIFKTILDESLGQVFISVLEEAWEGLLVEGTLENLETLGNKLLEYARDFVTPENPTLITSYGITHLIDSLYVLKDLIPKERGGTLNFSEEERDEALSCYVNGDMNLIKFKYTEDREWSQETINAFKPSFLILQKELERYAKTLMVWPLIIDVCSSRV